MTTSPRETAGPVAQLVRSHPLTAFLLWFFTVGQALAFAPVIANANGMDVPVQPFIVASTLVGLLLPSLVITRLVDGPDGLRALWRRIIDVRVSLGWYALALVGIPLLAAAIAVLLLGMPAAEAPGIGSLVFSGLLVPLFFTFVPNNLWEEVAWTGFVQARLQERRGPVVAAVITGVLFALQHISLVVGNDLATGVFLMVVLTALAVPFRFLTGWAYNRTASLFLVGLIHAMGNAVTGGSGFQPGALARLYPGDTTVGLTHLLAFAVLGIVVLVVTRGRLGRRRTTNPSQAREATLTAA